MAARRNGGRATLTAGPLKDAVDWLEQYRRFWEQSFERMADYLNEIQTKGDPDDRTS